MDPLPHKDIVLPEVDLSHDEGDPRWHESGGLMSSPEYREDGTVKWYTWNGLPPGHYAEYWQSVVKDWERQAARYEQDPGNVVHAYYYLDNHPAFWKFENERIHPDYPVNHVSHLWHECAWEHDGIIRVDPHLVCPETNRIEEDEARNTAVRWWYEFGPVTLFAPHSTFHDYLLDGGADTFEECVIQIARKVWENYGNDRRIVDSPEWVRGEDPIKLEELCESRTRIRINTPVTQRQSSALLRRWL